MSDTETQLREELKAVTAERNKYHAELTDLRLKALEERAEDHEARIRPLESGLVKANTIYALIFGNGILSLIALYKIFV